MRTEVKIRERESEITRRRFLGTGFAGSAALVVGFYIPADLVAQNQETPRPNPFNAWVRITPDGQVTLTLAKSEMGQGVMTALPMILAEELDADWSQIRVIAADLDPAKFGDQGTGGSDSVASSWLPLRQAGAAAREMLISAAAEAWEVNRETCIAKNGAVVHGPRSRTLSYGELVERASKLPVPNLKSVPLKNPDNFRIVGKSTHRTEIPSKVDGTAIFGLDVRVPGMLHAVIARCPTFGGKPARFDAARAKAVPGVVEAFEIPAVERRAHTAGGVAVVAETTAAAIAGRKALDIEWDPGPHAGESSESLRHTLLSLTDQPGKVIRNDGDAASALAVAPKKIEAVYELPFLAHATMEPMNCTVDVRADRAEVWAPTQAPNWARDVVAQVGGVPRESVVVHTTLMGGGFGRRYHGDFAVEAAQISKAVGKPVQVVWTREDDMQHDFYRPAFCHRMSAALGEKGDILAWTHRIASTSIRVFWDPPDRVKPERAEIGGADNLPYTIQSFRLEYAPAASGVPRAWWRSVEDSSSGFAVESFIDELAAAARVDPVEYRLQRMDTARVIPFPAERSAPPLVVARLKAVLQLAAEKSGWDKPLAKGRGRGLACFYTFNTYVAQVAEVSAAPGSGPRVHRVTCTVDCGRAVNPDGVRAQAESAIVYGLTAALKGAITIEKGAVQQSNFHDYPMLCMNEISVIEVHIVPSGEPPTGMGEPCVPLIAPAVTNAIFAATGRRIRRLPIRAEDLRS
jgi:isoquinoline 1-oxidoreductase beta subunit